MTKSLFQQFLSQHSIKKNSELKSTHTRIGDVNNNVYPGSFHISGTDLDVFHHHYHKEIIKENGTEYLTEKQATNNDGSVVYVDLDFRYNIETGRRAHNSNWIETLIGIYGENIKNIYKLNGEIIKAYVMERQTGYAEESKQIYKDGIHILFDIPMNHKYQEYLRKLVMKSEDTVELLSELPLENSINDVFDEGLSKGSTNVQLFGSNKPNRKKYELTQIVTLKHDPTDNEIGITSENHTGDINFETFKQLSVHSPRANHYTVHSDVKKELQTENDKNTATLNNVKSYHTANNHSNDTISEYTEYCNIIKFKEIDDYHSWKKLVWALASMGQEFKSVAITMSQKSKKFDIEGFEAIWEAFNPETNVLSKEYILKYAKEGNPTEYSKIRMKYHPILDLNILEKGENDVAKFIGSSLKKQLVYCARKWWKYNTETCLWSSCDEASATFTNYIQRKIDEAKSILLLKKSQTVDKQKISEMEEQEKMYNLHYKAVCKSAFNNMMTKFLKSYLEDDTFVTKLDQCEYQLVYKNGIYDMKTNTFNKGIKQSDYISQTLPFNYETSNTEDILTVREILKKICNYDESHLEYYLSVLGYCLTADSSREQNFWYYRGEKGSNGKSAILEALEIILPNYVRKANADVIDKGADLRKEIATWQGLRILWLNEVSKKKKDPELVKALCDGTSLTFNPLYAVKAVTMNVNFKVMAVGNHSLNISSDKGVERRFKLGQFNSIFDLNLEEDDVKNLQFKADKDLSKKLCGKYKHALIHLILEYSHQYWLNKKLKSYPSDWKEASDDCMEDNNDFNSWFEENCEIGSDFTIHHNAIKEYTAEDKKLQNMNLKDELNRLGKGIKYYSQEEHYKTIEGSNRKKKCKGFWHGFKLINTDKFGNTE